MKALLDMAAQIVTRRDKESIMFQMGTPQIREFRFNGYSMLVDLQKLEQYKDMFKRGVDNQSGLFVEEIVNGTRQLRCTAVIDDDDLACKLLCLYRAYKETYTDGLKG